MTTQTTAEKLRILADAEEAGEMVELKAPGEPLFTRSACQAVYYLDTGPPHTFARIPKPKEQIQVGERLINAPLKKKPDLKEWFWYMDVMGNVINTSWNNSIVDHKLFHNRNCWATEEDAIAWHEASLALRKGGAAATNLQEGYLQDIAACIGVGGYNGATTEQLAERIKAEFQRLATKGGAA